MKILRIAFLAVFAAALLTRLSRGADSPDMSGDLRTLIVDGVGGGAKPNAYINFLGKPTRVQVVGADASGVSAKSEGSVMPVAWKEIAPDQLGALANEFAKSGSDYLTLARFYAQNKLMDRAEKAALSAIEHDKALSADVAVLFKSNAPAAPVPATPPADSAQKPAAGPELVKIDSGSTTTAVSKIPSAAAMMGVGSAPAGAKIPDFKSTLMFDTPEADAVLSALQIFPKNNAWNEDISKAPVLPESDRMIAHLSPGNHVVVDISFNFIFVPATQARTDVKLSSASESDKGPYPVPDNAPVEGWPIYWAKTAVPLEEHQRQSSGDRHCIVIDPAHAALYEFYHMVKVGGAWTAGNEATWDLTSNKLRPKNWTSSDAAGLPVLPGLLRYDEIQRGVISHALRVTMDKTRKAFIYPATHHAGATDDPTYPAMGQRFRLKASVDLSTLPKEAQILGAALKKYGMIVADNGSDWFISATLDKRFNLEALKAIYKVKGSDFEAVQTTGER